ncbi:SDR family NAD(P)-dependent oxidoreductase [Pseudonocardia sp. NPDC046786]|uniref:SDR family NAD(P)-dependent oxidoreductase n=1 Tax=Pseudonocardia sp. NPDC046786 TaxID=3155471 RepID=UPI0033EBA759
MELRGATALVTGANQGFGRQPAVELVTRGATVYAAARRPELIDIAGVRPLRLDITDPGSVEAAARTAPDVDLLVNNAASTEIGNLVTGDPDVVRRMLDTHFHGTLAMIRAFAPVLAGNGGGAVLNVPDELARHALDGIEAGEIEILDRQSAEAKTALSGPPHPFDPAAIAGS